MSSAIRLIKVNISKEWDYSIAPQMCMVYRGQNTSQFHGLMMINLQRRRCQTFNKEHAECLRMLEHKCEAAACSRCTKYWLSDASLVACIHFNCVHDIRPGQAVAHAPPSIATTRAQIQERYSPEGGGIAKGIQDKAICLQVAVAVPEKALALLRWHCLLGCCPSCSRNALYKSPAQHVWPMAAMQ